MEFSLALPLEFIIALRDAAFIKLDMKVVSSVLEEIISEMPELVIPERKGIVDYINIEHDYYEIWERILKRLGREFVNILKETSFSQNLKY